MRHIKVLLGLSIVLLVIGCKKSPELATDYIPIFNSNVDVNVSEKKIVLKASFTQLETSYAVNSGFEWSEKSGSKTTIFNIGKPNSGELGMQIDTALRESTNYKIRAWVKVGEKIFYSGYAYFTGLGYPAPEITSINKEYAYYGESIIITGKYFVLDYYYNDNTKVKIDNIQCQVSYISNDRIGVQMPYTSTKGKVKISLNVLGKDAEEVEIENYLPEVYSVTPQSMPLEGEITISGKFHSEYKKLVVPVQEGFYRNYKVLKYTDDEIIIKRGDNMLCDSLYGINFKLEAYLGSNVEYLKTNFSVKRKGPWQKLKNTPFTSFDEGLTFNGMGYVIQFLGKVGEYPFWRYDPLSDQWTKMASFPGGYRTHPVFVECDGLIYCGLGKKSDYILMTDFWRYDPDNNTWLKCADLNLKSIDGMNIFGANILGTVFVFSEWNNQKAKYNPSSNSWIISACNVPYMNYKVSKFIYKGEYYFYDLESFIKYNLTTEQFDGINIENIYKRGYYAFAVKNHVYTTSWCLFSEIDMVNAKLVELYENSVYISPDVIDYLFVINDKPYFFYPPNRMSIIMLE